MSSIVLFSATTIVGEWLAKGFYWIVGLISYCFFEILSLMYKVFDIISGFSLFKDGDNILAGITNRVYTILGVVMLFYFAYTILINIVDPDKFKSSDDKSLQGILKNTVISLVALVLLPTIFSYMQKLQDGIIDSGVIGNIILGSSASENYSDPATTGKIVALQIAEAFIYPKDAVTGEIYTYDKCKRLLLSDEDVDFEEKNKKMFFGLITYDTVETPEDACKRYLSIISLINDGASLSTLFLDSGVIGGTVDGSFAHILIIDIIAAGFAAYLFLTFSFDLGVRVAKLGVLEIIAPIPIIMRIVDKGKFNKWFNEIKKTYLQIFERVIFIYFSIFLITLLPQVDIFKGSDGGGLALLLANVIAILGLLKFAKDAPKLISDVLSTEMPDLSLKKRLQENTIAKGAAGLAIGGVRNGINNGINRYREAKANMPEDATKFRRAFRTVGSVVAGGIGGTVRGAYNGARADYSHGMQAGINAAYQTSRSQNATLAGYRAKSDTHTTLGGAVKEGITNIKHTAETELRSLGMENASNQYAKQAASLSKLKSSASTLLDTSRSNSTKYGQLKATREKMASDINAGKYTATEFESAIQNAGFEHYQLEADENGNYTIKDSLGNDVASNLSKADAADYIYKNEMEYLEGKQMLSYGKEALLDNARQLESGYLQESSNLSKDQRKILDDKFKELHLLEQELPDKKPSDNATPDEKAAYEKLCKDYAKTYKNLRTEISNALDVAQMRSRAEESKK